MPMKGAKWSGGELYIAESRLIIATWLQDASSHTTGDQCCCMIRNVVVWVINGVAQLCLGSVVAWLTVRTASTHHLPLTGGCTQVQWRVIMHLPLSSGLRETFEKVCVPLRSKSVFGPVKILNKNCWSAYKQWDKETLRKVLQCMFKSLIEGEPENCGSHQERHQARWTSSGQLPSPPHHGLELHPQPHPPSPIHRN